MRYLPTASVLTESSAPPLTLPLASLEMRCTVTQLPLTGSGPARLPSCTLPSIDQISRGTVSTATCANADDALTRSSAHRRDPNGIRMEAALSACYGWKSP